MYRNVILEFLSANNKILLENNYSQMTLVLFPVEYHNLCKLFKDDSKVKIYHIKDQYTFYKEYDFSHLENSIIEMIMEYQEKININYEDISFEINDPYYLKDIRNQTFLSLELIPIIKESKLIGSLIIYSNNLNARFKLSDKKIYSFINKLYEDEENELLKQIKINIFENDQNHIVVKKDDLYYINDLLRKDHHFKDNVITKNNKDIIRLKKIVSLMNKKIYDDYELYYLSSKLTKSDNDDIEIYLLDSINKHGFNDEFSVIFTKDLESKLTSFDIASSYKKAIIKLFPEAKIKFYQVQNGTIGIIIDKHFSKKDENDLRFILKKNYYILINKTSGLTKGLDLVKLMSYLNYNLPFSFNYKEYCEYLDNQNKELLECDNNLNRYHKIMIKADTLQMIGHVVNAPLINYYNNAIYKLFENELINLLDKILKENITSPIITMCITSFNKRKIYEQLKKIISKYSDAKLIFHAPKIMNHNVKEMYDNINKAKELGFVVIVDSTIFMDLSYNICVKASDAVIIRKGELKNSLTDNNNFNKKLFESFYDECKVVIFEEVPKEEDLSIINELTCLFIDE